MDGVADRRNKTVRDMVISMVVLGVAALIFGWLYGGASFSPGSATADGVAPTADVVGGFQRADRMVPFSPAVPHDLPADWRANSFTVTDPNTLAADQLPTAQGGWLTTDGTFVTLVQAKGSLSQVLTAQLENAAPATSTVQAGGATWMVGPGRRDEVAWYREVGDGVVYLITGSADQAAFTAVAESIAG
jgi:hypothetical protein